MSNKGDINNLKLILIVSPHKSMHHLFHALFRDHISVIGVSGAEAAIRRLNEPHPIRLIICDCQLLFLDKLLHQASQHRCPVILFCSDVSEEEAAIYKRKGVMRVYDPLKESSVQLREYVLSEF